MKLHLFILQLFITNTFIFAQVDKCIVRENNSIKTNKVYTRKTWLTYFDNDSILIKNHNSYFEQFDKKGNPTLLVSFDPTGDTLEKTTFIYRNKGNDVNCYHYTRDTGFASVVTFSKLKYKSGKIKLSLVFEKDSLLVNSTKYFYDHKSRITKILIKDKKTTTSFSYNENDSIRNTHISFYFAYDTINFKYSKDSIKFIKNDEDPLITVEKYNRKKYIIDRIFLNNQHQVDYKIHYKYDLNNNLIETTMTKGNETTPYFKEVNHYNERQLITKTEYYQNDMNKLFGLGICEYMFYEIK